jgi:membrane protease YdiL (CAAX protease family)
LDDTADTTPTIPPVIEAMHPPPAKRTWPTWVEILLCSGYPTQLLISGALMAGGMDPQPGGQLSVRFVFALATVDTVVLLSIILICILRRGQSPRRIFFGDVPPGREAFVGVLSTPFVIMFVVVLMVVIRVIAPSLRNVPDNPLEALLGDQGSVWIFLFVVIVAGGVREELQRAFLLHRFKNDLGQPWMGLLITSLSFGLGHTLQGYDVSLITGSLGALWGAMYLMRGSALAPMVSHSLFNAGQLVLILMR